MSSLSYCLNASSVLVSCFPLTPKTELIVLYFASKTALIAVCLPCVVSMSESMNVVGIVLIRMLVVLIMYYDLIVYWKH